MMKPSGRYTILVADRSSGVVRRATVVMRPVAVAACVVLATPILIGMGTAWKAYSNGADLRASHTTLELENTNYRQATEALAGQIASLQLAIADLGERSALEPSLARAMDRLPALVKTRAMGGAPVVESTTGSEPGQTHADTLSALAAPDGTFGLLRTLLESLDSRLTVVARTVERRNALADATPSMWPSYGSLSSTMGPRKDPITGGDEYHSGLDIASDRGDDVYATAAGTVTHVGREGAYGNLIVIDHGFGLETRYGHLLKYLVTPGQTVGRGDVIAQVGATGRATGYHLHYEVAANGRLINPLTLLTQRPRDRDVVSGTIAAKVAGVRSSR
jgi:murein DD-endopeptidase MepM/ murein hydrolase activator NlpD